MRGGVPGVLFAVLFLISNLRAEIITHQEAGVELTVPDGWQHQLDHNLLTMTDPEGELTVLVFTSEMQLPERSTQALAEAISPYISHAEIITQSLGKQEVNGLFHYNATGFGVYNEEIVDWDLSFLAGARKSLLILSFGDRDLHSEQIRDIVDSIRVVEIEEETTLEEGEGEPMPLSPDPQS